DRHDENLDVRSLWLARLSLSRLGGGDPLVLARARDAVLARLHRGLSVERDVPRFLRFTSGDRARGLDATTVGKLVAQLEALLTLFLTKPRKRTVLEAPVQLTMAYVRLVFAFGFARLGLVERARALRAEAGAALDLRHPIHNFLVRAYNKQIKQ